MSEEFHPEMDSIRAYLELVSLDFKANDIAEDKQVPILLNSIGARTHSLLQDMTLAPEKRIIGNCAQELTVAQVFTFFSQKSEEPQNVCKLGNIGLSLFVINLYSTMFRQSIKM